MADPSPDFAAVEAGMRGVYERQAAFWHQNRRRDLREKQALDLFLADLPRPARLLDLGCGSGVPIASFFLHLGHKVTGVDFSNAMLDIARLDMPQGDWRVEDMRAFSEIDAYDGICSWDAFFHLSKADQRALLPKLAAGIRDGGSLMLTVGTQDNEVLGAIADEPVYHASLTREEYLQTLNSLGFKSVKILEDADTPASRTILLGRGRQLAV